MKPKGIPARAPKSSTSKISTTQCINVSLLLEALLKNCNSNQNNLDNKRYRIPMVVVSTLKKKESIIDVVNPSFGRGKRSASASLKLNEASGSGSNRRIISNNNDKLKRATRVNSSRSYYDSTTTSNSINNNIYNNNGLSNSMIRSSSAAPTHHRGHVDEHISSPLARSFSVGLEEGITSSTNTRGRSGLSSQPSHLSDYEMAYIP